MGTRIAVGLIYQGTRYHGFQRQLGVATIQQAVERALSSIADHPIRIACAGRTDSGVHATGQVIHFDTDAIRRDKAWVQGVNTLLPDDISVAWMRPVADTFDARHSATARRYQFILYNQPLRHALGYEFMAREYRPLRESAMQVAAQVLVGEHDFSAFRAAHCQANSPWRRIEFIEITRRGDLVIVDIKANAFLHHMVRNIVGSLCDVGAGVQGVHWIEELLKQRNRQLAGKMAAPSGLYLCQVDYPMDLEIPKGIFPSQLLG
jgi:tRNA pseudouridine38-40 synthase